MYLVTRSKVIDFNEDRDGSWFDIFVLLFAKQRFQNHKMMPHLGHTGLMVIVVVTAGIKM